MNPMEDRKIPIKVSYLKAKIHVVHYLITRILLPGQDNLVVVIKEDVFPLWLLTQNFQTTWVEVMLIHMIHYKQTQIVGLPYEALITKILVVFRIYIMGETVDVIQTNINHSFLRIMRVCIFHGELRNESMDEDEVIT